MGNDDTFIKVTNKDIYDGILDIKKEIVELKGHVQTTNGKVKLNAMQVKGLWAAILVIVTILIWIFQNATFR
jgi:hypothetical protein